MQPDVLRKYIWFLLVSAIPLFLALRWSAINCPIKSSEYQTNAIWIDDQYAVVQFEYLPIRSGVFRSHQCVFREYLVDCKSQTRTELLGGGISRPDYGPAMPEVAPDGTILRLYPTEVGIWVLQRIDPRTLESRLQSVGEYQPKLIGGRFLIRPPTWDSERLQWQDVTDDRHSIKSAPFNTYGGNIVPINGGNAFYVIPLAGNLEWTDEESGITHVAVDWLEKLKNPSPSPHPTFVSDIEMMMLYRITENGPELLDRWPVVGGSGLVTTQTSGGYIATLRIDASAIDVRSAVTGKITLSVPVPADIMPADFRPNWGMDGATLTLKRAFSGSVQAFDLETGSEIPTDGMLDGLIHDQSDSYYIKATALGRSSGVHVRERQSGKILNEVELPAEWHSLRFSRDGSQLKCLDHMGNATFVDRTSGETLRQINFTEWNGVYCICKGLFAAAWANLFWTTCTRVGVPHWLKAVLLSVAVLCFVFYRLNVSGHNQLHDRLAWQVVFAMIWAWGFILAQWLVSGRIPLIYRLIVAGTTLFIGSQLALYLFGNSWIWKVFYVYLAIGSILLTGSTILLRYFGWINIGSDLSDRGLGRISLRNLFLWMTLIALLIFWGTKIDWKDLIAYQSTERLRPIVVSCSLCVFVVLTTAWSLDRLIARGIAICSSLAIAIFSRAYLEADGFAPYFFVEGVWYGSYQFFPLVGCVAIISRVRRGDSCIAG